NAQLYGRDTRVYGGLNAFFLLMDEPETYQLPSPRFAGLPSRNNLGGYLGALGTAVLAALGALIALRRRRQPPGAPTPEAEEPAEPATPASGGTS
ncbi:MAG TPA: 4Fe-4S ferredoxin, partial [Candidatus Binatia bacterium]|nr:4Fe-4S ferredoxin [Candidatus Binatia bacterium]